MGRVLCSVTEEMIEREGGNGEALGVVAECSKCSHKTESFGVGEKSIRRCLVLMREECPEDEENFYVNENE